MDRDHFLGRGPEFDTLAAAVGLATANFVLEAVDDVSAVMDVLQARRRRVGVGFEEGIVVFFSLLLLVLLLCPIGGERVMGTLGFCVILAQGRFADDRGETLWGEVYH